MVFRNKNLPSDELLRFSVENASLPLFWVSKDGNVLYANEKACVHLEYDFEELIGLNVKAFAPDFNDDDIERTWKMLKEKKSISFSGDHLTKTGKLKHVLVLANYACVAGGEYRVVFIVDITDKVKAEEEVVFLNNLIDKSNDCIFVVRQSDAQIIYVNQRACSEMKRTFDELTALTVPEIRRPVQEDEHYFDHLSELQMKKEMVSYGILNRKDGSEFPVETSLTYVPRGDEKYHIAIARNIENRLA